MKKTLTGMAQHPGFQVRYYLLEEPSEAGPLYGVSAEWDGEALDLPGVTASQVQAYALLDALARGCVTPATLRDVVEDWLLA